MPFHRTRHIVNSFNSNREVKVSRDGKSSQHGLQLIPPRQIPFLMPVTIPRYRD